MNRSCMGKLWCAAKIEANKETVQFLGFIGQNSNSWEEAIARENGEDLYIFPKNITSAL